MSVKYDLQVIIDGWLSAEISEIIAAVSSTIGLYPGYTYVDTQIEPTATGDVIHIYYIDEYAISQVQAEVIAIPAVVYAVLGTLAVLGIVVITSNLVEVIETSPEIIYAGLAIAGIAAVAYLVSSIKGKQGATA